MKAFPTTVDNGHSENQDGMDLRDYFAAKAMPEVRWTRTADELLKSAMDCYAIADAMMKAREQT
jgi:hypothetical protein